MQFAKYKGKTYLVVYKANTELVDNLSILRKNVDHELLLTAKGMYYFLDELEDAEFTEIEPQKIEETNIEK